jgi:hypothetical protein
MIPNLVNQIRLAESNLSYETLKMLRMITEEAKQKERRIKDIEAVVMRLRPYSSNPLGGKFQRAYTALIKLIDS